MSSTTEKKQNSWILHCKQYAKDNNVSYKDAIKQARATYVKPEKIVKPKIPKVPKVAELELVEEPDIIEIMPVQPPVKIKKQRKTKKDIILQ